MSETQGQDWPQVATSEGSSPAPEPPAPEPEPAREEPDASGKLLTSAGGSNKFYRSVGEGDDRRVELGELVVDSSGYVKFQAKAGEEG